MDILKELFLGNISPDITACKSDEFKKTLAEYNKRSEILRETLSDNSKKLLDDVLDEYMHIASITEISAFKCGFTLATQIMCQCFGEE